MLEVNRSIDFWTKIVEHPSVGASLGMTTQEFINCVTHPRVTPLASENGGYLVIDLGIGLIAEFHAVFTELGWGREVFNTGCELVERVFKDHDILTTYEIAENRNSRPPLSFGFKSENRWINTFNGDLKLWYLTKSRWADSPVYRRMIK